MKRFIRYLYEYEDGRRLRNVGFVRVDQEESKTTLQIHGKGLDAGKEGRKFKIYLFFTEEKNCMGIYMGEIEEDSPVLNYEFGYTPDDTVTSEHYNRINGMILRDQDDRLYAAMWNEDATDICQMQVWEREQEEVEAPVSDNTEEGCEETEENDTSEKIPARKIQKKEMVMLPRCEWRLANNSFLIHGYYNYHHLILTVMDNRLKLGVPGVYYPEEAKAAENFGFPEFVNLKQLEVELAEDEQNRQETFGYWCREVRGSVEIMTQ